MARPRGASKVLLHVSIPVEAREMLDNILFVPSEGRVPVGAYAQFIVERIEEYSTWTTLDLSQFGFETGDYLSGPPNTMLKLEQMFNRALERQK